MGLSIPGQVFWFIQTECDALLSKVVDSETNVPSGLARLHDSFDHLTSLPHISHITSSALNGEAMVLPEPHSRAFAPLGHSALKLWDYVIRDHRFVQAIQELQTPDRIADPKFLRPERLIFFMTLHGQSDAVWWRDQTRPLKFLLSITLGQLDQSVCDLWFYTKTHTTGLICPQQLIADVAICDAVGSKFLPSQPQ